MAHFTSEAPVLVYSPRDHWQFHHLWGDPGAAPDCVGVPASAEAGIQGGQWSPACAELAGTGTHAHIHTHTGSHGIGQGPCTWTRTRARLLRDLEPQ